MRFTIPFGSWYEPGHLDMEFPGTWNVTLLQMAGAPEVTDRAAIEKAINSPVGTQSIAEIARGKLNAVIAIDDISRSTRLEGILEVVLKELNECLVWLAIIREGDLLVSAGLRDVEEECTVLCRIIAASINTVKKRCGIDKHLPGFGRG